MLGLTIPLSQIQVFLLIFLRVVSILFSMPLFDARNIPATFKVSLAFSLSLLIYPLVSVDPDTFRLEPVWFLLKVVSEVAMGLIIGFSIKLIFSAVQLAGQLAGFQMGFAIVNVMDPATSSQVPVLGQLNNLFAMLIFLSVNAHHWFLKAVVVSFEMIPPFAARFGSNLFDPMIDMTANLFVIAIKVGAPIISVMLLTSIAMGLLARAVPQMQIFIVAMPLKILIGFLFIALTFPFLAAFLGRIFRYLGRDILFLIKLMASS